MTPPGVTLDSVMIAGGGAVALTAALSLVRKGVPVTVLEAEPEPVKEFRGSTFHPPTLEMLDGLGVAEDLIAQGVVADKIQYRDRRDGMVAEFDMGILREHSRFPFRLQIDQYALSALLFDRLREEPSAEVRFDHTVTEVALTEEHCVVTAETADGPLCLRAPYVIGADGGNSAVRRSLDIAFEGMTYPERYITLFTTFDFSSHMPDIASVNYVSDPREWTIMLRSPNAWRVLFPARQDESDDGALADYAVQARLRGLVAVDDHFPIVNRRLYKVHQRVATTYRRGRVLLAGDAAHVNNPIGGMGLNGGIHDAVHLSEVLARVWRGEVSDATLDGYAHRRRRVAIDHVQAQTHLNALAISEKDPAVRSQQRADLRRTAADPDLALRYLLRSSMIASLRDPH